MAPGHSAKIVEKDKDGYGQYLLAQFKGEVDTPELIERDDDYIDFGSHPGMYLSEFDQWSPAEQQAIAIANGRVLDVGCGAGRHSLWLQEKGFDVTAIDSSPGAIEVCKLRGVKNALLCPIADVGMFEADSFDTILMLGNNFGLLGEPENARSILKEFSRITTPRALIIAGTRDPYDTDDPVHIGYHEFNRRRGRMAGQIRIRVRYRKTVGEWFDYLFVSREEMREIVAGTDWQIAEFIGSDTPDYLAVLRKNIE